MNSFVEELVSSLPGWLLIPARKKITTQKPPSKVRHNVSHKCCPGIPGPRRSTPTSPPKKSCQLRKEQKTTKFNDCRSYLLLQCPYIRFPLLSLQFFTENVDNKAMFSYFVSNDDSGIKEMNSKLRGPKGQQSLHFEANCSRGWWEEGVFFSCNFGCFLRAVDFLLWLPVREHSEQTRK